MNTEPIMELPGGQGFTEACYCGCYSEERCPKCAALLCGGCGKKCDACADLFCEGCLTNFQGVPNCEADLRLALQEALDELDAPAVVSVAVLMESQRQTSLLDAELGI